MKSARASSSRPSRYATAPRLIYPAAVDVLLSISDPGPLATASGDACAELFVNRLVNQVGPEGHVAESNAGCVGQGVRQRRRHRVDRALAHALGAQRSDRVVGVREMNLRSRDIGVSGNA